MKAFVTEVIKLSRSFLKPSFDSVIFFAEVICGNKYVMTRNAHHVMPQFGKPSTCPYCLGARMLDSESLDQDSRSNVGAMYTADKT